MTSPTDWEFTGGLPTVPPASATDPIDPVLRASGYKEYASEGVGCLHAALATLLGQRAQLVAAALGDRPDIPAVTRFVELWSGDLTLEYTDVATGCPPRQGKALLIYRAAALGRHRGEAGRFVAAPVHAAVVHADDLSMYHDPHLEPLRDPQPLGFLHVVTALHAPAIPRFRDPGATS